MNKQQILAAFEPLIVEEPIKALGGAPVRFRELSGAARDTLFDSVKECDDNSGFEAALIVATVVDESGEALFGAPDIEVLRAGRTPLLDELSQVAMRLNGIGQRVQEQAVKN